MASRGHVRGAAEADGAELDTDRAAKRLKSARPAAGARVLMVDNFDSFTHNIVQYMFELGADVSVVRNNEVTPERILAEIRPTHVVLSPGPGRPADAGCIIDIVRELAGKLPILGVCLGHQAICEAYGGSIVVAPEIVHGKRSPVTHGADGVFAGIPSPYFATRYHSLVVEPSSLPDVLEVTARCVPLADPTLPQLVMGVKHREHSVYGVQFHPESVLTEHGYTLLANFLAVTEP